MKVPKFFIFILFFIMTSLCIPSFLFAMAEEKFERIYPLDMDGKVYLENISGDIVVKSWAKNEVKILARKTAREKEILDRATVDVHVSEDNIRILTRRHDKIDLFKEAGLSVDYDIVIPHKTQIKIKSVSGSVRAYEIGGNLEIETVSGRAVIAKAGSGLECKTVSGSISAERVTGNAVLKSTSGRIALDGIKGSVEANSVSGSIELKKVSSADEIEAESVSGSMEMQGELNPGGIYRFSTFSGGIKLTLPEDSGFELKADTMSGSIRCGFELNQKDDNSAKKIRGVAGNGGARLEISSFSGSIQIKKSIW